MSPPADLVLSVLSFAVVVAVFLTLWGAHPRPWR